MELHVEGWPGRRSVELDVQQRVYVNIDAAKFLPFTHEELDSSAL